MRAHLILCIGLAAAAISECLQPLMSSLTEQNKYRQCGWE
jgi:hypothetical protein